MKKHILIANTHKFALLWALALLIGGCLPLYAQEGYIPLQGAKYRYTFGFDVGQEYIQPINDFQQITQSNRKEMAVYVAYRTLSPWGFELGYRWTDDKMKNFVAVPGTQLFGATAQYANEYQGKIRLEDTYIDLYAHYPFLKRYEAKIGVGVGFIRQNIVIYPMNQQISDPLSNALLSVEGRTTMTARVNCGVQTLFTGRFGGRILFSYETTSSIKSVNANPQHMFTNSYSILLGLYYNITGY